MGTISTIQNAAKTLLKARGFAYDTRHFGAGHVTIWRRRLRKKSSQASARPKRLVVVPGFGDTPLSWLPALTVLEHLREFRAQKFDELAVLEFSGHIGSLNRKRAIDTVGGLITAVTAVVDELEPHTLVGQSMGGFLSAYYASELGARGKEAVLERLVLLCPAGMSLGGTAQERWERLLARVSSGDIEPFIERAIGPRPKNPVAAYVRHIITSEFREFLLRKESISILSTFEEHHEMNARAARIRVPTLLVWGGQDALIPIAAFELWSAKLGAPRTVVLKKAGHGLHIESPLAVARAIAKTTRP